MISFKTFITEGGNVKVKTADGEVSAAPFKIKDRAAQSQDVHDALTSIHNSFHAATGKHLFGKDASIHIVKEDGSEETITFSS